jgi:hypothetical protein
MSLTLSRQLDGAAGLKLVGIAPVAGRQVRPDDVHGAVLHLPDVAELVRDQVVGGLRAPDEDRPHERVAVVALQERQAEEPRRDAEADAAQPDWAGIEVEPVEARLRPQ